MLRILFLILVLMVSFVFAQTEEKPQAIKFDQFSAANDEDIGARVDNFFLELNNNPSVVAYIVNFGTVKEIAKREKQIKDYLKIRRYDQSRITFVQGGFRVMVQTQFWTVPAGAETPKIESSSKKIIELGKANTEEIQRDVDAFFIELNNNPDLKGYIINYGSAKMISDRQKQIKSYIAQRKYDLSRITFLNGGLSKTIKTEMWVDSTK